MSFSCPHFVPETDACVRLRAACVPGRPGCVLTGATFAVSVEERLRAKEEEIRASASLLPPFVSRDPGAAHPAA